MLLQNALVGFGRGEIKMSFFVCDVQLEYSADFPFQIKNMKKCFKVNESK